MSGVGGPYSILFRSTDLKIMFSVQFHRAHVMDVSPCSQHRKRTPAPPFWSYVFLSCLILHETFAAVFFAVFFCFDFSATCFLVGRSEFWSKPYYPKPVESLTQISWIQSQVASDWWFLETQDKEKKQKTAFAMEPSMKVGGGEVASQKHSETWDPADGSEILRLPVDTGWSLKSHSLRRVFFRTIQPVVGWEWDFWSINSPSTLMLFEAPLMPVHIKPMVTEERGCWATGIDSSYSIAVGCRKIKGRKITKSFRYQKSRVSWTLFSAMLRVGFPLQKPN